MPQLHKHLTLAAILVKKLSIILFGLILALSISFIQDKSGKILFKENCASCHAPTKPLTAPPFQRIRSDYGLDWTVKFVTHCNSMLEAKNANAIYIYYLYNKTMQNTFTNLKEKDVTKILDYVDTFPYDSLQYQHRKLPNETKQKFIKDFDEKERQEWEQFEKSLKQFKVDTTYSDSTTKYGTSGYGNSRYASPRKKPRSKTLKKARNPSRTKNGG